MRPVMNRGEVLRRSGRGDATVSARIVRMIPAARASSRWFNSCLAQNWGLVIVAAAAMATVALSLGKMITSRPDSMAVSARSKHQSLFASPMSRGGISIARIQGSSSPWSGGRALQESTSSASALTTPVVEYETKLQLFMCNPSLEVEGNDAYIVNEASLATVLSKVNGLKQADADAITVTIKTGPVDADDDSYMCDVDGMLQWHAQIKYSAADAAARDTTPAVMAAQANDYVAYARSEFTTLLAGNINDEYIGVGLSAGDIVVPTVGWIVTFPAEESFAQETTDTARSTDGLASGLRSDSGLWVWWVWLIYALLVACCLVPLCCCLCRRREDEKNATRERLETTRKNRGEDGLAKIRGPEWGVTELDYEGDHNAYQSPEMEREYDAAGKGIKPTAYKPSHNAGQQSISAQAWMQEAGKRSAWTPQSYSNSPQQSGGHSPVVRRFDIDDDDVDDGVGKLRNKHPQYSFDVGRGGFGGRDGESKS